MKLCANSCLKIRSNFLEFQFNGPKQKPLLIRAFMLHSARPIINLIYGDIGSFWTHIFYSMAKKAQPTPSTETLEPRIYEIGYLLSPAVRDEDLEARVSDLKATITKAGGEIISEGDAEFIDLAYEMTRVIDNKNARFNQAYFGWIKFEIDPAKLVDIKEAFDKNILIIRHLLTKTVRENTVIGKKPLGKMLKGKRGAADESAEGALDAVESADSEPVADQETVKETSTETQD